jgi:hypothetical protein
MDLYAEFKRIVGALNTEGIRYALAGGLAVSVYAAPRATVDIDLLIAGEDADRAVRAVSALGFRVAGRPMEVARGRLRIQRLIKTEGADLVPLDLLIPVDAELVGLLDDRSVVDLHGELATVVSDRGLRILKRLRGSTQDRADLEAMGPES